jgi:hypothetical protein
MPSILQADPAPTNGGWRSRREMRAIVEAWELYYWRSRVALGPLLKGFSLPLSDGPFAAPLRLPVAW